MEIEVGKHYITSNGNRVFVRKKTDHPLFPFQGEAEGFDGILSYTKDGRFMVTGDHPFNITSEAITDSLNASGGEKVAVGEKNVTLTPPPDPRKVYEGVCIDGPLRGKLFSHRSPEIICQQLSTIEVDAGPGFTHKLDTVELKYRFMPIFQSQHSSRGLWISRNRSSDDHLRNYAYQQVVSAIQAEKRNDDK